MRTAFAFLILVSPAMAGDNPPYFTTDKIPTFHMEPPSLTYTGQDGKMIFVIHPDGHVEIGKDIPMDEATRDFWKGIEAYGFKCHADR
jgi:hypothetical protein